MPRGRPVRSQIRENIIEIIYFMGKACGYDLYKKYIQIFPKVTMRVIYYHLKKGLALGEFKIEDVQLEKGNYSWGTVAQKTYYSLGPNAKPRLDMRVKEELDRI